MAEQDLTRTITEQSTLIDSLKNALVQRDLRIGQLELVLSKALVSTNDALAAEINQAIQPPPPASHPFSPLISAETKGLYNDGWTSPVAHLVFHPGARSGAYQIFFWLPNGAEAKQITLQPAGGEQQTIKILPGRRIVYNLDPLDDILSPISLRLETERSAPKGEDRRNLGVVLVRVVWVDKTKED